MHLSINLTFQRGQDGPCNFVSVPSHAPSFSTPWSLIMKIAIKRHSLLPLLMLLLTTAGKAQAQYTWNSYAAASRSAYDLSAFSSADNAGSTAFSAQMINNPPPPPPPPGSGNGGVHPPHPIRPQLVTSAMASSGTGGDRFHFTNVTKGARAYESDHRQHDYSGNTNPWQQPISGGNEQGLPYTRVKIEAWDTVDMKPTPSGQWHYGFAQAQPRMFKGVTYMKPSSVPPSPGTVNGSGVDESRWWPQPGPDPLSEGGMLPPTSTSSFDFNTVDCPFIRKH